MDFLIWNNGGGTALFDPYSLYHVVFFIAIVTVLFPILKRKTWIGILFIMVAWEIFEAWVVNSCPKFPYAGKEDFLNKFVGDSISDLIGVLIAFISIHFIKKRIRDARRKTIKIPIS